MKNLVAGSITFSVDIKKNQIDINHILTKVRDGVWNIYLYGETELQTSNDVVKYFESIIIGKILTKDISISTEDRIILIKEENISGEYHISEIEGETITFDNCQERLRDQYTVAIREAEVSKNYGNRVIKIDKFY